MEHIQNPRRLLTPGIVVCKITSKIQNKPETL